MGPAALLVNEFGRGGVAVIGAGRLGSAITDALASAGVRVAGPRRRGDFAGVREADVVLLCVPDREIRALAAVVPNGPLIGHCSGALGLDVLAGREGFSLHPLMTVTRRGADFRGAGAALAATSVRATGVARALAIQLGLEVVEIDEADRAAYHAAASMASNFLVTLEAVAERIGAGVGLERRHLVPLARAALENWATDGAADALTGPIARGDDETAARQRDAVARVAPALVPLWDALAAETRAIAVTRERP